MAVPAGEIAVESSLSPSHATGKRRTERAHERRQEQGDATRTRILEGALKLFAENGFDGTTFRAIAKHCDVAHTAIAYHFASKELLWRDAVALMFEHMFQEVEVDSSDIDSKEGYKAFIRRYVRYCARHPEHARLMVQESVRGGDRLSWAIERFILPGHMRLAPFTLQQTEEGNLPKVWPWSTVFIIVAMCQAPFTLASEFKHLTGLDSTDPVVVEAHADAVIAFLFRDDPQPEAAEWPMVPGWLR